MHLSYILWWLWTDNKQDLQKSQLKVQLSQIPSSDLYFVVVAVNKQSWVVELEWQQTAT